MYDIFITGTFRNDWNQKFNSDLEKALTERGYKCYLPQRDTPQLGDRKATFEANIAGVDSSKLLLAIGTKTQTANWGLEIGYAFKSDKPVIIITDEEHPVELMPEGAASVVIEMTDPDDQGTYLEVLLGAVEELLKGR